MIPFSDHHLRADLRSPPDVDLDPFGFLESIDDDIEISADLERFVVLNRLFRQKKKKKKKKKKVLTYPSSINTFRQLKQNEKGEWVLEKKVNPRFYSFLVGKSAMTKKQIERFGK